MADNTPLSLPYAHLNLRCNPFCKIPPEEESEVDAFRFDLGYFARQLKEPGFAFQIL
ncbi:MAG: hypothetical protein GTO14_08495 [Anaerolineales bacterium]|nr:hypothetical protein [Anaerolineales bacterium]